MEVKSAAPETLKFLKETLGRNNVRFIQVSISAAGPAESHVRCNFQRTECEFSQVSVQSDRLPSRTDERFDVRGSGEVPEVSSFGEIFHPQSVLAEEEEVITGTPLFGDIQKLHDDGGSGLVLYQSRQD